MKNALTRSIEALPGWLIQAILGLILTGSVAWATWTTKETISHSTRLSVTESNIATIKDSQKRIEDKLDRVIERR